MFNTEPFTIAPPMQVLLNDKVYVPLEPDIVSKRKAPAGLSQQEP